MRANEIMGLLGISRATLSNYVKSGKIKGEKRINGTYDYDRESVYKLLNGGQKRYTIGYFKCNDIGIGYRYIEELEEFSEINKLGLKDVLHEKEGNYGLYKRVLGLISNNKINRVIINKKSLLTDKENDILRYLAKDKDVDVVYIRV